MGTFIYVGNLGPSTTESMVRDAFTAAGSRTRKVVIMRSAQKDRSRGFGFVELESEEEAQAATQAMDGKEIEGRPIKVGPARERAPSRSGGFQSYSGLGGRMGGRTGGPRRSGGAKRKPRH